MALIDWAIVVILIISVLSAAKHGFFVEAFSLAGVVLGLMLASWNYQKLLPWISPWVHSSGVAEAIAFIVIAIAVMVIAGLAGRLIRWSVRSIGLGWADRFIGAIFGLLKGCVLVTLGIMAIAAFLPHATWLERSKIAPYFLSLAHEVSVVTPVELGERIREGVRVIRDAQPDWLKPNAEVTSGPLQHIRTKPGTYPDEREVFVKRELETLVTAMHAGGITYAEAVREFKRRYLLTVLANNRGNQCKAAKELGVHRNTLSRIITELEIDPAQVRNGLKRPPRSERPVFDVKQVAR